MKKIMNSTKQNYATAFMFVSILFMSASCSNSDSDEIPQTMGQLVTATRWQTTEVFEDGGTVNKIEDYPAVVSVSTWTLAAGDNQAGTFAFRNVSDPEGAPRAQGSFKFIESIRVLTFPNGSSANVTMTRLDSKINEYVQYHPQQIKGVPVVPQKMVVIKVVHKPYPLK